jgi:hypothetical protein
MRRFAPYPWSFGQRRGYPHTAEALGYASQNLACRRLLAARVLHDPPAVVDLLPQGSRRLARLGSRPASRDARGVGKVAFTAASSLSWYCRVASASLGPAMMMISALARNSCTLAAS